MQDIIVRNATQTDMPSVLALVNELAVFEKEPDAVTATLDNYNAAHADGLIGVIVAELDNEIIGMSLFYDTFSTWKGKMLYLEDFVVKEEYRSMGIGQRLFDATLIEAKRRQCVLMKWQVLDWNIRALNFYKRNEAIIEKEWWNGKIFL